MDLSAPGAHTLHRDENPPISAQLKSVNLRKRFSSPLRFSQIYDTRAGFASGECPCKAPRFFPSDLTKTPLADLLSVGPPCPFVGVA